MIALLCGAAAVLLYLASILAAWAWGFHRGKRWMLHVLYHHLDEGASLGAALEYERGILEGRVRRTVDEEDG